MRDRALNFKLKSKEYISSKTEGLTVTLTQVKTDIASLTIAEKATVIEFLLQTLSQGSQGITKTPGVCGGDACIDRTRLPVWLFVSLRSQGATDAELLQFYPHLSAADLVNVWAYADAHSDEIETALREEAEAMIQEL